MGSRRHKSFKERVRLYIKRLRYEQNERAKRRYKKKVIRRRMRANLRDERHHTRSIKRRSKKRFRFVFPPLPHIPLLETQNRRFLFQAINSTAIFIISYILVYFLYQFTVFLLSSYMGTESIHRYYNLAFSGQATSIERLGMLFMATAGPIVTLIAGFILFRWVFNRAYFAGLQRLFILWLAIHGVNHFFGALISGAINVDGYKAVASLLHIEPILMIFVAFISILLLGWIGYLSTARILETTTSLSMTNPDNRRMFFWSQIILPWIIGSLILAILIFPSKMNYTYELLTLITMGFALIPAWLNRHTKPHLRIRKIKVRVHNTYIMLMVILLFAFWVALMKGLAYTTVFDSVR